MKLPVLLESHVTLCPPVRKEFISFYFFKSFAGLGHSFSRGQEDLRKGLVEKPTAGDRKRDAQPDGVIRGKATGRLSRTEARPGRLGCGSC